MLAWLVFPIRTSVAWHVLVSESSDNYIDTCQNATVLHQKRAECKRRSAKCHSCVQSPKKIDADGTLSNGLAELYGMKDEE